MNHKRLKTLADFLRTVHNHKFDLANWRKSERGSAWVADESLQHGCGTTACAIGWACSIPEFKEEGLGYYCNIPSFVPRFSIDEARKVYGAYEMEGWDAVTGFFGIDQVTAMDLFMASSYEGFISPDTVADRIQSLLDSNLESTK